MTMNFDKYAQEGNRFINELASNLGYPDDRDRTARVLRAVFNTMRDMLPAAENMQLSAQLPMMLKAVYLQGYDLRLSEDKPRRMDEFLAEVKRNCGRTAEHDFGTDADVGNAVRTVFHTLRQYISSGEMEDIVTNLPKDMKHIISPPVIH
jgi:uncharacterized protein (DUF2267 family)